MSNRSVSMLSDTHPSVRVNVTEPGGSPRRGWQRCAIGEQIKFRTELLETYLFACWDPLVYDLLLLAAAVEFCDKVRRRSAMRWGRLIELSIPVHDIGRWTGFEVGRRLHAALEFLTGDKWVITFRSRIAPAEQTSRQQALSLPHGARAVMPYSNGLDSRAVAALVGARQSDGLVKIRLGVAASRAAFAAVPYSVSLHGLSNLESSGRARGFKFTLIGAIGAYLANVDRVVMPESGQGAIGPVLVPVGQAYEDYRNHPAFTDRMTAFLKAILGRDIRYEYPRLWFTKGETLTAYIEQEGAKAEWRDTRSCWQRSQQMGFNGKLWQCGICAACQLRRMSLHAAGLQEAEGVYMWNDLKVASFEEGAHPGFNVSKAQKEYAIAGVLHLDHLAALADGADHDDTIDFAAFDLSRSQNITEADTKIKLTRLLSQHKHEWRNYVEMLGPNSFIIGWAGAVR